MAKLGSFFCCAARCAESSARSPSDDAVACFRDGVVASEASATKVPMVAGARDSFRLDLDDVSGEVLLLREENLVADEAREAEGREMEVERGDDNEKEDDNDDDAASFDGSLNVLDAI